ncbi:MAG: hypothetical protein ACOX4Q_05430 [Syntrophomonadales bacterium]
MPKANMKDEKEQKQLRDEELAKVAGGRYEKWDYATPAYDGSGSLIRNDEGAWLCANRASSKCRDCSRFRTNGCKDNYVYGWDVV